MGEDIDLRWLEFNTNLIEISLTHLLLLSRKYVDGMVARWLILFSTLAGAQLLDPCDSTLPNSGGDLDLGIKVAGTSSLRWQTESSQALRFSPQLSDWSLATGFSMYVRSLERLDTGVTIVFYSDNPATEGLDYYFHDLKLLGKGWEMVRLPLDLLKSARTPVGWQKIDSLILIFSLGAAGYSPTLHFDELSLFQLPADGPVLGDSSLMDALDGSVPGLQVAFQRANQGDAQGTLQALAQYLRNRTNVTWSFDPRIRDTSINVSKVQADSFAQGWVTPLGIPHKFEGSKWDWNFNATGAETDPFIDYEWQWHLCRMDWWDGLGRAWSKHGDSVYAKAWVAQFRDFVQQNPVPLLQANRAPSTWRTIEAGYRYAKIWPNAYYRFLHSPFTTDTDLLLWLKTSYEHADYLMRFPSQNNELLMESDGLFTIGGLFPEFDSAVTWRSTALDRVTEQMDIQFRQDGMQFEHSPGYHSLALANLTDIYQKAKVFGRLHELPSMFLIRLESAYDVFLKAGAPDRTMPRLNDAIQVDVNAELSQGHDFFSHRNDWLWIYSGGALGNEPDQRNLSMPETGWGIFRSDWSTNANFALFDGGGPGAAHIHQDALSLVLWSHGRQVLVDDGGGNYADTPWRRFAISTAAHSTARVDGMGQKQAPSRGVSAPLSFNAMQGGAFAEASYNGPYATSTTLDDSNGLFPGKHTRTVYFVEPEIWVVRDEFIPANSDEHEFEVLWQLADSIWSTNSSMVSIRNLLVVPLNGAQTKVVSGQQSPEILGYRVDYGSVTRSATIRSVVRGKGVLTQQTLLVALADTLESWPQVSISNFKATLLWPNSQKWSLNMENGLDFSETNANGSVARRFALAANGSLGINPPKASVKSEFRDQFYRLNGTRVPLP